MNTTLPVTKINNSRRKMNHEGPIPDYNSKDAAEGGCGVIGLACNEAVAGKHLLQALTQMRNRGNGKGGGIAAVGLDASFFGVSQEVLDETYLLAVAYLEPGVKKSVQTKHIDPQFEIETTFQVPMLDDHTELEGLEVRPPEVQCYFVRPRKKSLEAFANEHELSDVPDRVLADEFVYQNTYRLNREHYAEGTSQAFVLSHGKNQIVLKMVGYGDDVVRFYKLEELKAHVWIGHHRYPTKGRVWHPGGAHPFIGMNEALVHNGDFANYASVAEYLAQRNIYPMFQTDTEVSALVFDLHHRTYGYPMEYVIESLAPTTERDFTLLNPEKQSLYQQLQQTHMHGSPDGPWFFLIAQNDVQDNYRLVGITDTSMLRPQVFAMQEGQVSIGFAASEKQGIDAALASLAAEDDRFWTRADRYWNARGGSHTDGGAFVFDVVPNGHGRKLSCTNKFGATISTKEPGRKPYGNPTPVTATIPDTVVEIAQLNSKQLYQAIVTEIPKWNYGNLLHLLDNLKELARQSDQRSRVIEVLNLLMDRRYPTGKLRRSSLLSKVDEALTQVFEEIYQAPCELFTGLRHGEPTPTRSNREMTIVIDASDYPIEDRDSLAMHLIECFKQGWRNFIVYNTCGHRFIGNGLGSDSKGTRIHVYGSPGDYLASGLDGCEMHVHNNGQDQLGQILKSGQLVIHGDVGQTFMYGAKGGEVYILGNAAGRPLINAVGRPRVVINGTCLDYLAESFMAGDPLDGGGFVILNGLEFDAEGQPIELDEPYPGGNLFSLASGGALYVRDPHGKVSQTQLNGGEFAPLTDIDWQLIQPYLVANERHFDIPVNHLLTVNGELREPTEVYRKIRPVKVKALSAEEAWAESNGH